MIHRPRELVLLGIYYWLPDHHLLLNEFWWQTLDVWPEIPRCHQFLNHWHANIEATISEVLVSNCKADWRKVDWSKEI